MTRIFYAEARTSLGEILVAATEKGVCRLSFDQNPDALNALFPGAEIIEGGEPIASLLPQVITAVEEPGIGGDGESIPLDVSGTEFQLAVWQALRAIPAGETRSYGELAEAAGYPKAVRAAGSANGANRVAVLIPCHRVIRSDGALGGYAYGSAIKGELLRREGASFADSGSDEAQAELALATA